MWGKYKLFIEEAPEPDDVDWEFVHIPTKNKFWTRIWCLFIRIVFMGISFGLISGIANI